MDNAPIILKVKDPPDWDQIDEEYHEHLPPLPQSILFVSPPATGKTNCIVNLLTSRRFYRGRFSRVYIISPTIFLDKSAHALREDPDIQLYSEYDDSIVEAIVQFQREQAESAERICIVYDNIIQLPGVNHRSSCYSMICRFRHITKGGMVIYSSQMLKGVPPLVRSCSKIVIVGNPIQSIKEMDKLTEEYGAMFGGEESFQALMKQAHSKGRYNFAVMRLDLNPAEFWENWDRKLYPLCKNNVEA